MKKILIVKMSAVGDVVMTLPALAALKNQYPEAAVDWLVEPAAAGLLHDIRGLNRVIISPRRKIARLIRSGQAVKAGRLLRLFRKDLRSVNYDVVIDLQGLTKSAGVVWMARGRRKVGFAKTRERTGWALNEKMPAYDPERHAVLRYLDAAVYLGAVRPKTLPERYYQPSEGAKAAGRKLIEALPRKIDAPPQFSGGLNVSAGNRLDSPITAKGVEFIVLNTGAKWATKRWPAERWLELARLLAENAEPRRIDAPPQSGGGPDACAGSGVDSQLAAYPLVLTGGPDDAAVAQAICEALPPGRALNLCGRTSLPALGAILADSRAVVTCDTGPMHLAAAVGAGGLALFGPTKPNRTGPFGGGFEIVQPKLDCLGCLKKRCDRPCLSLLTAEDVYARLKDYLKKTASLSNS
ncbi:glycosyltransferase family 9 protein [Deltaproteobacteria bacterium OttesenSCG-928-K17]|nr:glycosyltransferase family 9 protein [Deltaproteobacteria bacterium OttesenSCG-928-K17]